MVLKKRAVEALSTANSDERGKLLFFLGKVSDKELGDWDIEGQDDETILSFIREAYMEAKGGSLPAAAAAGVGTTSAEADDDIIMQRADVSRKFIGQVEHDVKDPTTGEVRKVPSCVVVITSKFAATFAHKRKWKEGEDVELKICSTDATSMRVVKAKVFHIDRKVDFVILKFTGEELQAPDTDCGPRDGMKFYGHGLSCPKGTANVYHGIIGRANIVGHGYIALDRLSGKGDSGGGIFSAATGRLLGMMVGRDKDLEKSYIIPAAVLAAATAEEMFDPDPPPSDQSM